jgi:hypothetical protein
MNSGDATLAPDHLNSYFITWCLNIDEAFTTKLELTSHSVEYGDYFGALKEPIVMPCSMDPLPTEHWYEGETSSSS